MTTIKASTARLEVMDDWHFCVNFAETQRTVIHVDNKTDKMVSDTQNGVPHARIANACDAQREVTT